LDGLGAAGGSERVLRKTQHVLVLWAGILLVLLMLASTVGRLHRGL